MKVLWFTNTACSATETLKLPGHTGGWLKSLERELSLMNDIDLHVGFYHSEDIEQFIYGETTFHPIFRKSKQSRFNRLLGRFFFSRKNDSRDLHRLNALIKQVSPDIIHIHGTEENFGLVNHNTSIPIIFSLQGILNPYSEKFFSGIPAIVSTLKTSVLSILSATTYNKAFRRLRRKAEREKEILNNSKYIIGRTDWDRRVSRILAPKSIYFTGQEMLRPAFYIHEWEKKEFNKTLRIITVSGTDLYKGVETIIKTAKILIDYTDVKFEWHIIGIDKNSLLLSILKKWLDVSLEDLNLVFLGRMNEYSIVQSFLGADIYCQVSHIENSPNSLCEAMMIGLPIIATDAGGTTTLLKDNIEGIVVQEGEPYSIAGTIFELKNDFNLAWSFAKNAKLSAEKRHNKKAIIKDLVSIYNKCI